jgi:hypothetical protein
MVWVGESAVHAAVPQGMTVYGLNGGKLKW